MAAELSPREQSALTDALARQSDESAHDLGLIAERLSWTPVERLQANAAWVRFYLRARPDGPLIDG